MPVTRGVAGAVASEVTDRDIHSQVMGLRDELALRKLILECQTEAAIDGIITVNADGAVMTINRACREMFRLDDAIGRPGVDEKMVTAQVVTLLARPSIYEELIERVGKDPLAVHSEQLALRDGREVSWTNRPIVDGEGHYHGRVNYYSDITRMVCAERDALANEARARAVIEGAVDAIVSLDDDLRIIDFNRSAARTFGWTRDEVLWQAFDEVAVERTGRAGFVQWTRARSAEPSAANERAEFPLTRQSGAVFAAECAVAQRSGDGWVPITLFARDVSVEKKLEMELRQAQKLESVGRLASGIAHEINTPLQFVGDSLYFIREATTDLLRALTRCRSLREHLVELPAALAILDEADEAADLEFLETNVPRAIDRAVEGLDRVASLVEGLKELAHQGAREKTPADLNRALEMTLISARNEYGLVAEVATDYGELPPVTCVVGEINQAFLVVVVNAAHAIADVVRGTNYKGRIGIRTWADRGSAFVAVSDTGTGILEAIRERIFDPFFTTKDVGRGSGQGLAIARSIIVDKHGGELTFETQPGSGTTFTIRLPIQPPLVDVRAA
jgi:two-component system NtrC family sensor kinase